MFVLVYATYMYLSCSMTIVYSNEEEGELLTDSQVWQWQICMAGGMGSWSNSMEVMLPPASGGRIPNFMVNYGLFL